MLKFVKKTGALLLLTTTSLLSLPTLADPTENQALLDYLNNQTGMTAVQSEQQTSEGYYSLNISYQQPVDHKNPHGEQFTQQMTLMHKSADSAMALETKGYTLYSTPYLDQLAGEKGLNQLAVEHRFFGPSTPQSKDWSKLTIKQAADDMHRIVGTIRPFYQGKWISTGASKGGMTAMYYRYFYPRDVDATLANVAPVSRGRNDQRYVDFIEDIESDVCHDKLTNMQKMMFERQDEITDYMNELPWWTATYDKLGYQVAYDKAVAEYYFQFFQYSSVSRCDSIAGDEATTLDIFYEIFGTLYSFTDDSYDTYEAYNYQAYTQLGYPQLPTDHLEDYLTSDPNDYEVMLTAATPIRFDRIMRRVNAWTRARANTVMVVYGETDPWSTGQFKPRSSKRADNYRFMVPDAGHWSTIFSLTGEDRDTADAALARWLDLPAPVSAAAKGLYVLRPTTPSKTPENVFASAADHTTDAERLEYIKYIVTNKIPARR